jgi:transposase
MPLAFTVAPCNMNDKKYFKPLLEKVQSLGVRFKAILSDSQYNSGKVKEAVDAYGAEPVIPVRWGSRVKEALRLGRDFVIHGTKRLAELFKRRRSVERLFGYAMEWLMLDGLRVHDLEQVDIHAALCFTAMLATAHAAILYRKAWSDAERQALHGWGSGAAS